MIFHIFICISYNWFSRVRHTSETYNFTLLYFPWLHSKLTTWCGFITPKFLRMHCLENKVSPLDRHRINMPLCNYHKCATAYQNIKCKHRQNNAGQQVSSFLIQSLDYIAMYQNFLFCHDLFNFSSNKCPQCQEIQWPPFKYLSWSSKFFVQNPMKIMWENSQEKGK